MSVYLIQDVIGRVKIGYSDTVYARKAALQTAHSEPLRLIRVVDGGKITERWMHRRFSSQRLGGEWFTFSADMLTVSPPDEIPVRRKVVIRRDIRLTVRERFDANARLAVGLRLTAKQTLLTLSTSLTEEEAAEMLALMNNAVTDALPAPSNDDARSSEAA